MSEKKLNLVLLVICYLLLKCDAPFIFYQLGILLYCKKTLQSIVFKYYSNFSLIFMQDPGNNSAHHLFFKFQILLISKPMVYSYLADIQR